MPRPPRCRRICGTPENTGFTPDRSSVGADVILSFDEFEVIRLVDAERQTHEQCARQMEISRTTVTEIYESARAKLAECLVYGRRLTIDGGHYRLCDGAPAWCYRKQCARREACEREKSAHIKGENVMRIAVTYENGEIFQHFGHTGQFKFYDVQDGKVISAAVADTNGSGHGALAGFLVQNKADMLICGGIGGGAQTTLAEAGIKLYGGVSGSADEAVQALLDGTLDFNPDVRCSHHDHGHGDGEHHCGDHGCGKHGCH